LEGKTLIVVKSLYGLKSSAERWRAHFADTLRSMGFMSSRADPDVWLRCREDESGYDYICTHVDDFAKDPWPYMKKLQSMYVIRDVGPPQYYLGNDFFRDASGRKYIGSSTYVSEAITKLEAKIGVISKERSATIQGDHPELDTSPLLDPDSHRLFQMLIGMGVWIVQLGRFDLAFAVTNLSRFTAAPRQGHLERAIRMFGYLKRRKHRAIGLDAWPPLIDHGSLHSDVTPDYTVMYPDAAEDVDTRLPRPLGAELEVTSIVDADHGHDQATRRSISGILLFVGRTPVAAISKRQASVQSSTYGAEFLAARVATEEILSLRYFLRSFGVPVSRAARIFGDNMSVLLNISHPDSQLKKKHLCIAYHILRENIACHVLEPFYIPSGQNYSDFLTKALCAPLHEYHADGLLYQVSPEHQLPFFSFD
jgi:hypothetical protein